MDIYVIGDIFMDILTSLVDEPHSNFLGKDCLASSIKLIPGGSGLNTSIHMDYLSESSSRPSTITLWSQIGQDHSGHLIIDFLSKSNIKTQDIWRIHGKPTGACVVLSTPSDRGFITDRGAISEMKWEYALSRITPLHDKMCFNTGSSLLNEAVCVVHFSGYLNCTALLNEEYIGSTDANENSGVNNLSLSINHLRSLRDSGHCIVTMNPQSDATNRNWGKVDIHWMKCLDILITNEEEAERITSAFIRCHPSVSSHDGVDRSTKKEMSTGRMCIHCRIAFMIEFGGFQTIWIVTRGSLGSRVYDIGRPTMHPENSQSRQTKQTCREVSQRYHPKRIVDTTGAGDAFCAGFITRYSEYASAHLQVNNDENKRTRRVHGTQLIDCLDYANFSGARTCTVLGGSNTKFGEIEEDDSLKVTDLKCTCCTKLIF